MNNILFLKNLSLPPYETIETADPRYVSWKIFFLVAISSAKRHSARRHFVLQALCVNPPCLIFHKYRIFVAKDGLAYSVL